MRGPHESIVANEGLGETPETVRLFWGFWSGKGWTSIKHVELSNEKWAPGCGCLGYIGDYTTRLRGDYNEQF